MNYYLKLLALIIITFALTHSPLRAEEKRETEQEILEEEKEEPKTEKPAGYFTTKECDFEVTFPEAPRQTKRCNARNKCTQLTSYTMVYDLAATVEVSVSCVPSTPKDYARYNDNVVRTVLKSMVGRASITTHDINVIEKEDIRQGSLIGTGKNSKQSHLYNAQIWVGQNSVMTIEAKLIGEAHPKADDDFGSILASVKKKD